MAAMLSSTTIPTVTMASATTTMRRKTSTNVVYIKGMGCFEGLKANTKIANLGSPVCTNYKFSQVVNSLRSNGRRGGGALSSTCSASDEIFKIAAIMNGLTLVGVAIGFILLKIESIVEETE